LPVKAAALLRRLERLREAFGAEAAARKRDLLAALGTRRLARPSDVARLHEALCFMRAYPDTPALLRRVERMLDAFPRRRDLVAHRDALADTGIAGTEIRYSFYAPTAIWLAGRWQRHLRLDWERFAHPERLESLLPLFVHFVETPGLDEWDFGLRGWLRRLKGPRETGAAFVARRFAALRVDGFTREAIYDSLDIPLRLVPGPGTPSRTRARHAGSPAVCVRGGLERHRPALPADALRTPLAVREVGRREAGALIDLAREAMITRQRDLDLFSYASPADVRMIDWEDGLQFACIGAVPERRLLLESVYAFLTLRSGVPLGYVLVSALFGSSEIAYNVFETFRGGEAGFIYGRVLATTRHLFGSDAFTIFPYQLGQENDEAIRSGAWWFYQKIGFRPLDAGARRLMRRELARMRRRPGHRSSPDTLRALAASNLYYFLGRPRPGVIGGDAISTIGLKATALLARRFGSDRERGARVCSREAAGALGVRTFRGWSAGERQAWERWAPLVLLLRGLGRWRPEERRALAGLIRAKGGRRESDYVARFNRHPRLQAALLRLGSGSAVAPDSNG
jgi:hypothetical protein